MPATVWEVRACQSRPWVMGLSVQRSPGRRNHFPGKTRKTFGRPVRVDNTGLLVAGRQRRTVRVLRRRGIGGRDAKNGAPDREARYTVLGLGKIPRSLCARGDLNPHALSDTGT